MAKLFRLRLQSLSRTLRRRRNRAKFAAGLVIVVLLVVTATAGQPIQKNIDPDAYATLLTVIAQGESKNNYNAYFNNASNTNLRFTEMSVDEVLQWQAEHVHQGSVSSAVGRYQIVRPTMLELVRELGVDLSVRFDESLQDRMAIALLERRGSQEYVNQKLSREQFAANIAKEWAALPRVIGDNPAESYYAGDGINASRVTVQAVYEALDVLAAGYVYRQLMD